MGGFPLSKGLIFIVISMMSIGLSIPIGGVMMEQFPVFIFSFITILIATIILVPFSKITENTKWTKLGKKNYFGMFMQALLTVTLYTVFQLYGLTYASVISVGIITSITPAVVLILSLFLLRERLSLKKSFAVGLAIVAVLVMELSGVQGGGENSILGIVFMLSAVVSLALFFVYAKKFSVKLPPFTLAAGLCLFGAMQTFPMAIYELTTIDLALFTEGGTWLGIILFALTGWIIAYCFTFLALPKINASTAGMATAVIPIVATAGAILFLGEALRVADMIGLVLVVASIIIAESQERSVKSTVDEGLVMNNVKAK